MTQQTGLGVREDGSIFEPAHRHTYLAGEDITSSSLPLHAHWVEEGEEFTEMSQDHRHPLTDKVEPHVYPESEVTPEQLEHRRQVQEEVDQANLENDRIQGAILAQRAAEAAAWDEYWASLTPEEQAQELSMMDAHGN